MFNAKPFIAATERQIKLPAIEFYFMQKRREILKKNVENIIWESTGISFKCVCWHTWVWIQCLKSWSLIPYLSSLGIVRIDFCPASLALSADSPSIPPCLWGPGVVPLPVPRGEIVEFELFKFKLSGHQERHLFKLGPTFSISTPNESCFIQPQSAEQELGLCLLSTCLFEDGEESQGCIDLTSLASFIQTDSFPSRHRSQR